MKLSNEVLIEKRCCWMYNSPNRCKAVSHYIAKWAYNNGVSLCKVHANGLKGKATGLKLTKIRECAID